MKDGEVYHDLTVFRVQRTPGSIVSNGDVDLCAGFGFGSKEGASRMLLSLSECLLIRAMT